MSAAGFDDVHALPPDRLMTGKVLTPMSPWGRSSGSESAAIEHEFALLVGKVVPLLNSPRLGLLTRTAAQRAAGGDGGGGTCGAGGGGGGGGGGGADASAGAEDQSSEGGGGVAYGGGGACGGNCGGACGGACGHCSSRARLVALELLSANSSTKSISLSP